MPQDPVPKGYPLRGSGVPVEGVAASLPMALVVQVAQFLKQAKVMKHWLKRICDNICQDICLLVSRLSVS